MATNFSANQYDNSYDAKRLQNWQISKKFKERPSNRDGCTQIISDDRGHLLSGVVKSNKSPWGEFKGTWDMDCRQTNHCHTLIQTTQEPSVIKKDHTIVKEAIKASVETDEAISENQNKTIEGKRHVKLDVPVDPSNKKIERQLTPHQSKEKIIME